MVITSKTDLGNLLMLGASGHVPCDALMPTIQVDSRLVLYSGFSEEYKYSQGLAVPLAGD